MFSSKRRSIPAMMAGALGLTGVAAFGQQAQPSQQELLDTVKSLQAKVAQLESKQAQTSYAADKALADRTVAEVIADAEKRSQLLAEGGLTSGWLKGKPIIQSDDGKFTMSPSFQLQFRGVASYLDESAATGEDDFDSGFEVRRMKFGLNGKYAEFDYRFLWVANRSGGGISLEDVEVGYKLNDTMRVYLGQFKDPVHHEELVSSSRQAAVDRSLANELLGGGVLDRVQGVGVSYESGQLFGTVVLHDGANSDNTNYQAGTGSEWGGAVRVEYTVFGDKKQYADFSAMGNKGDMLVIGAGGDITGRASDNLYTYTIDAQWENAAGLGIYGAVLGQTVDGHSSESNDSNFGAIAQVSYMLDAKWEVFGRGGWIHNESAPSNDDDIFEITGGVNYYFYGHNAKFTADVTCLPNGSPADSGLGYRDSGDELQIVGRVQFQLAI